MGRAVWLIVWCGLVLVSPALHASELQARHRRPVALAWLSDQPFVAVANERSGTLSVVDWRAGQVVGEWRFGSALMDVVPWGDRQLLAVDHAAHELLVIDVTRPAAPSVTRRISLPQFPTSIRWNPQRTRLAITCLWSETVVVIGAEALLQDARALSTVSLPFCPRACVWLPDGERLVVADAFGGRLAAIQTEPLSVVALHAPQGHNICDLAVSINGERLLLSQQLIHADSEASRDDIHWGSMLNNVVHTLELEDVFDPAAEVRKRRRTLFLGDVERGGADPAGLLIRRDGKLIVALAGVDEVVIDRSLGFEWKRVPVGARPTALALTADESTLVVANTLDDSLSVIDVAAGRELRRIALGPMPEPTALERGERLFFDGRRSHDAWLSCHSCHPDGHTAGVLVDNSTDGGLARTFKRTLSLRGIAGTEPYAWSGAVPTLAEQMQISVESTMHGERLSEQEASDLAAYVESFPPTPSIPSQQPELAKAGASLFRELKCGRCHAEPEYTTPLNYNVGLVDEAGRDRFNPPSLHGVRFQSSWFHDGRAKTLDEVVGQHRHQLPRELSEAERRALVEFLKGL